MSGNFWIVSWRVKILCWTYLVMQWVESTCQGRGTWRFDPEPEKILRATEQLSPRAITTGLQAPGPTGRKA